MSGEQTSRKRPREEDGDHINPDSVPDFYASHSELMPGAMLPESGFADHDSFLGGVDYGQGVLGGSGFDMMKNPDEWRPESTLEPPTKRQATQLSPLEKLTSNQYLVLLRQLDVKLKNIRQRLIQRDLQGLDMTLHQLKYEIETFREEYEALKSGHFLLATDFNNLLSLEEFLINTLRAQLTLYEIDYSLLTHANPDSDNLAVHLAIVNQGNAGPIFKDKILGPFTLRLLTGATITQIQSGPVQPEIADPSSRIKKNNAEIENSKQNFKENGTATFGDLKFASGTFPNLIRLKFHVQIRLVLNGQKITRMIESNLTKPYISMTNTDRKSVV